MPRKKEVKPKPVIVVEPEPTLTCCLCGKEFVGWGNNPSPLADEDKKCCDECNYTKVIPARLAEIAEHYGKE